MRPFFFRKPTITEDRSAVRFRERNQRRPKRGTSPGPSRSILRAVLGFLKPSIKTDADRAALAAAEAKRNRRRLRNIRWWSNDKTWAGHGRVRWASGRAK